jgi:hypothetical protein
MKNLLLILEETVDELNSLRLGDSLWFDHPDTAEPVCVETDLDLDGTYFVAGERKFDTAEEVVTWVWALPSLFAAPTLPVGTLTALPTVA